MKKKNHIKKDMKKTKKSEDFKVKNEEIKTK